MDTQAIKHWINNEMYANGTNVVSNNVYHGYTLWLDGKFAGATFEGGKYLRKDIAEEYGVKYEGYNEVFVKIIE